MHKTTNLRPAHYMRVRTAPRCAARVIVCSSTSRLNTQGSAVRSVRRETPAALCNHARLAHGARHCC